MSAYWEGHRAGLAEGKAERDRLAADLAAEQAQVRRFAVEVLGMHQRRLDGHHCRCVMCDDCRAALDGEDAAEQPEGCAECGLSGWNRTHREGCRQADEPSPAEVAESTGADKPLAGRFADPTARPTNNYRRADNPAPTRRPLGREVRRRASRGLAKVMLHLARRAAVRAATPEERAQWNTEVIDWARRLRSTERR